MNYYITVTIENQLHYFINHNIFNTMHITCYTQFLAEANRISDNFHQPWECKLEQTKINWIINELSHGDSCLLTCIFGT